jgi:hypothetical protein
MLSDESLLGIQRANPNDLKPIKLQLPLKYVLALHRQRIVGAQGVSEIVTSALEEYFAEQKARRAQELLVAPR